MSDISKVFEVDDILTFWMDISEIIRVRTPTVSPRLLPAMHTDIFVVLTCEPHYCDS
jgi:hypothetical protein